jgi:hypothetical protein
VQDVNPHYPAWRFHPEHGSLEVKDEVQRDKLTPDVDGWKDTPAGFPKPEPAAAVCPTCGQTVAAAKDKKPKGR